MLQSLYDAVHAAALSLAGATSLLHEAKVDVVTVPNLSEHLSSAETTAQLSARFAYAAAMKSMNNLLLLGDGEIWSRQSVDFAGLPEMARTFLQVAAGAADIPVTRLLGQSPSGLSATGESDVRNYYDMIAARQELDLRPQLERLDRLICWSEDIDEGALTFSFRPLWQLDEPARAALALTKAQATQVYAGLKLWPDAGMARLAEAQLVADGTYPNAAAVFAESEAAKIAEQGTADALPVRPGFNPAQPRDPDGRWTITGGVAGSSDPDPLPDAVASQGAQSGPDAPDGTAITLAASRGGRRRGLVPALGALVGGIERFLRRTLPEDPDPDEAAPPPPARPSSSEEPPKPDPRAGQKLDNALSDYRTRQYKIDNQTFQLDKAGMRHILERHAPEYWDGDSKGSQTFFEPGTSFEEIQDAAGDVLGQNRDAIIAKPSAYERKLTGTSRGRRYTISTYQGRVTQVYPWP